MATLTTVYTNITGEIGIVPRPVLIKTTATLSEASAAGFLNPEQNSINNLSELDAVTLLASDGIAYGGLSVTTDGVITFTPAIEGGGDIIAGSNGSAGKLESYPATQNTGHIEFYATSNSGNYTIGVTNASHGQATVYSIPDVGASTGQILVKSAALVSGNVVVASGTAGKVADGGVAPAALQLKANLTAIRVSWAGGGTSNAFAVPGAVGTSVVTATILSEANAAYILTAVPGTNIVTVTFNADPGAVVVQFHVFVAPQ